MKAFQPIVILLNKLKYPVKFLIVGCMLIIPLFIISFFFLNTKIKEKHQIEKRLEGAEYNILLKDILQNTQQSRTYEISLQLGDESVKNELDEVTKK